jgi:hypothetical protein
MVLIFIENENIGIEHIRISRQADFARGGFLREVPSK